MKNIKISTIGILGGYSKIGKKVIDYLLRETDSMLLIGGRDITKGKDITLRFPKRVTSFALNIFDKNTLNDFCKKCDIIINLVGPTIKIMDKIALIALENCCHYIDIGCYDLLLDALASKTEEIKQKNLIFVVGAGWMPGVSGIFPKFIIDNSFKEFDNIDSLKIYYGASQAWSYNSCLDLTWSLSLKSNGIFEHGKWKLVSPSKHTEKIFFPSLKKSHYTTPYFDNQLKTIAKGLNIPFIGNYVIINNKLSIFLSLFIKTFLSKKPNLSAKLMKKEAHISAKKGSWGLISCVIDGSKNHKKVQKIAYIHKKDNYEPTAIVSAITAKLVLKNQVEKGLDYLCHKVDPSLFMSELETQNINVKYE